MPQISIIMPAYNAERTITETVQSVLQQTFHDFELIVINDGSNDKTQELVQEIVDERLQIFSYENGGVAKARNRGIAHAKGEFIAFIDADDLWTLDKLELQLAALRQNLQAGVAYSRTCFMDVDDKGEALSFHPSPPYSFAGDVYEQLLVSDFIHSGSNTLIRSQAIDAVGEFDPTIPQCADWDYWLRLATHWSFVVVPKYQILYRRTPGAMSSKVEGMKAASLLAIEKAYGAAPPELQHLKSQTLKSFHIYCASLYLQHSTEISEISQAKQHLWSAIRLQPKTLLDPVALKLALKFLLKQVFSPKVANYLFQWIRKPLAVNDPRLQS